MITRVIAIDGKTTLEKSVSGHRKDANELGIQAANALIKDGAKKLLADAEEFLAEEAKVTS